MVDNSNDVTPFDWCNAYLEVDFKINTKADRVNYMDANTIPIADSGF